MKTPQLTTKEVYEILDSNNVKHDKVCVLAIRGYYLDSMGKKTLNDRGIYDDAMFVVWPDGIARFQGNTDPSGYRKGSGTGASKGMAVLKSGIWLYGTGKHKGRVAFRQCEPFTVIRDGLKPYEDTGFHAINLHSGGSVSTSSLGCQTVPVETWLTFKTLVYSLLEQYQNPIRKNDNGQNVRSFDYVLLEETERRKGNFVVSKRYL
jgi:hypothetical protein